MGFSRFAQAVGAAAGVAFGRPAAAVLAAQTITLQIRPHVGDTLRMRLDQQTEMIGFKRTSTGESNAALLTTMVMFSRAIVDGNTASTTGLLAVTDSVLMSTTDERSRASVEAAARELRGHREHFHVAPDGTVALDALGSESREVAQVVSLMPAAFPKGAIRVGESWSREMPVPTGSQFGAELSGKLRVTFRLDSVVRGGEWAFVSMHGDMQPATGPGAAATAMDKCVVNGTMLIDQRRRWLTESWFNILVTSTVAPAATSGILSMRMQLKITQHMHTAK